jgi:hypothetical protein
MEAVHKTREAAEIGRRQIYEKARDLVFSSADLMCLMEHAFVGQYGNVRRRNAASRFRVVAAPETGRC